MHVGVVTPIYNAAFWVSMRSLTCLVSHTTTGRRSLVTTDRQMQPPTRSSAQSASWSSVSAMTCGFIGHCADRAGYRIPV